jgi:hypothetical protein
LLVAVVAVAAAVALMREIFMAEAAEAAALLMLVEALRD